MIIIVDCKPAGSSVFKKINLPTPDYGNWNPTLVKLKGGLNKNGKFLSNHNLKSSDHIF